MKQLSIPASHAQAFASILAGHTVDEAAAPGFIEAKLQAFEAKQRDPQEKFIALLQQPTAQAEAEVEAQAPIDKYADMTDSELRAELCIRTSAFVSPNMTIPQIKAKLEAMDLEVEESNKAKAKAKPVGPKTQRLGVGKRQVELLKEGKSVDETLKIIQEEFPEAKTTKACVSWYKSKIKAGQY